MQAPAGPERRGVLSVGRFVLPRLLRRPVRVLGRLGQGEFTAPPFAATILSGLLIGSSLVYGASLGGQLPGTVQAITARTGFAVDQLHVTGHRETSEIDIIDRLELDGWTSLVGFDASAARERIAQLPWVSAVAVRKVYPDSLEVKIEERKPFAIWQHGNALSVVEENGNVITEFSGGRLASLPLLVGLGAARDGVAFVNKVRAFPEIASRVKGYIRVAERRWDLRLDNGITVRLPEHDEDKAIADLIALDRDNGLLSRDIAAVDLRFPDRMVVQLTQGAVERREASLKLQSKTSKTKAKAEKRI
ncbi:MAG: cell division protein FtsQ/DivIB [Rhizobiaceae bacterium]|nr:cell division protein FtsQ/DivIB [Rhizobiaceae bacterium]